TDPDTLTADVEEEGPDAIQISAAEVEADTAGDWPLKGEGNLQPPPGGQGPLPSWSAMISKVELYWETYDLPGDNEAIDDHPAEPSNGGRRIFPGKKEYDDSVEDAAKRRLAFAVLEFAEGGAPASGTEIYFRLWDVDDPSASAGPIDEAGSPNPGTNGPDNRDASACFAAEHVQIGKVKRFDSTTACEGYKAKMTIRAGMQPGDNWRFAVAWGDGAQARLEAMTQAQADARQPPDGVAESEMLTTWRKLHLELDSMAAGQDISPSGTIIGVAPGQPQAGESICIVDDPDPAFPNDGGRYEGGKMVVTGGGTYDILDNWIEGGTGRVVVNENASEAMNKTATFTDDDVPLSPRAVDWSLVNAKYAPAYIEAALDPPQVQEIPFTATVPGTNEGLVSQFKDHKNRFTSPSYWATQIVSGFQAYGRLDDWVPPRSSVDGDPDAKFYHDQKEGDESITGGNTVGARLVEEDDDPDEFGHNISALWLEAIRDWCGQNQLSAETMEKIGVVHELGWVFGWPASTPGTPMALTPSVESEFNEEQIKWFREKKDVESESPVSD
ncbi:MAG TPA: hypothetical protein VM219_07480, partial [Phycisphaerae bacterium]|nr:hypothetical protein [Phycisphaerae bacterium]